MEIFKNMMYILVCKICDAVDCTLLNAPLFVVVVVKMYISDLKVACFIFLYYLRLVYFYFFYFKGTTYNVHIMIAVVFEIRLFFCCFPHSEDVIFFNFPYITLC